MKTKLLFFCLRVYIGEWKYLIYTFFHLYLESILSFSHPLVKKYVKKIEILSGELHLLNVTLEYKSQQLPIYVCNVLHKSHKIQSSLTRTIQDQVIKGKTWRSLDLAGNQSSHSNQTSTTTVTTTNITSVHHNSLINNTATNVASIHYQRHDFKNRRSSSEPANEQKMLLAHLQNTHITNQTNENSNKIIENSLVENPSQANAGDEFIDIDCHHQKNLKVSEISIDLKIFHF